MHFMYDEPLLGDHRSLVTPRIQHKDLEAQTQDQCLLFTLPGELRNQIYSVAMTTSQPIIDPSLPPTHTAFAQVMRYRTEQHYVPPLGTQLLRTCKRIRNEVSLVPLYSNNIFRFSTWFSANCFLTALPVEFRQMVLDVEIDLRGVSDSHPATEREWIQYLKWTPPPVTMETLWTTKISRLPIVAPHIKTLRLNIECWRVQQTMRSVALLKEMLSGPKDLERIIMTGSDGSELLFGTRDRYLQRWGPVTFVGVMRFARLAGMIDWMAGCVRGKKNDMIVMWKKEERSVSLEIMTGNMYRSVTGRKASGIEEHSSFDIEGGQCSLDAYEKRWSSRSWPKEFNHQDGMI